MIPCYVSYKYIRKLTINCQQYFTGWHLNKCMVQIVNFYNFLKWVRLHKTGTTSSKSGMQGYNFTEI
jgi:aspartate/glutamate racemase